MIKHLKPSLILLIPLLAVLVASCNDDVVEPQAPTIVSISPEEAAPGTQIIIAGTNLEDASVVRFGSVETTIFDAHETAITVDVPADAVPGSQDLTVTTPGGSVTRLFTVL